MRIVAITNILVGTIAPDRLKGFGGGQRVAPLVPVGWGQVERVVEDGDEDVDKGNCQQSRAKTLRSLIELRAYQQPSGAAALDRNLVCGSVAFCHQIARAIDEVGEAVLFL